MRGAARTVTRYPFGTGPSWSDALLEFLAHLKSTGYEFWDESANSTYRLFLAAGPDAA